MPNPLQGVDPNLLLKAAREREEKHLRLVKARKKRKAHRKLVKREARKNRQK